MLDLKEWTEPSFFDVGIDRVAFIKLYFQNYHNVVERLSSEDAELLVKKLSGSYSMLYMMNSFLSYLSTKTKSSFHKAHLMSIIGMIQHKLESNYPPILLLMNTNGTFCYRTKKRVAHVRYIKQSQRDLFHYDREGGVEFIQKLMSHPRVTFAFYSSRKSFNVTGAIY